MHSFEMYNPTNLIFGKDQLKKLNMNLKKYGKKVLFVYGGGSIKKSGLYDQVIEELGKEEFTVYELSGVEPNPRLTTVQKGVEICKSEGIDVILAVGGGSVIDATKLISVGAKYDGNPWDIVLRNHIPTEAIPFGTILTLAATGSEMNCGSVITNWDTKEKFGWGHPLVFPKFSILDPVNTFTVPMEHTVNGIVDIMAHIFEQYFHTTSNTPITDRLAEGLLVTVIETAPKLVADLMDYDARETILYAGTVALNGSLSTGVNGDWASHNIEHSLSALYDISHGGGLAILYPNWMMHVRNENIERFVQFATRVFNVDSEGKTKDEIAVEGIEKLRQFWNSIGAPSTLADYGINGDKFDEMVKHTLRKPTGQFKKLNEEDVKAILTASL